MEKEIKTPHELSIDELIKESGSDPEQGLSQKEAESRLQETGPNQLQEKKRPGFFKLLLDQFNNFLIIILIAAAAVSFFVGEPVDAAAILVIVVLNAVLGVVQESKAEQALEALKKMSAPEAEVIRDGKSRTIEVKDLVPGDLVVLEAGSSVPADLRLIESANLRVDEAALTGESMPADKKADIVLNKKTPLGDRINSLFMGTSVAYGRGMGVVTATGMKTEMGKIAGMLQSYEEEETPLQRRLDQLGKWLGIISLSICGLIFIYGLIRDTDPLLVFREGFVPYISQYERSIVHLFMTAVSLAIAAVPEGLPAVVTICLALGMQRMVRRHALIRKLPAVETLGTATIICTDKTGTLTQNQMTIVEGWVKGKSFTVSGEGYKPEGTFSDGNGAIEAKEHPRISAVLRGGLLCNDSTLEEPEDENGGFSIHGDPTEGAFVVAAAKAGLRKSEEKKQWKRISEFPFTSERKRMTTIHPLPRDWEGRYPGLGASGRIAFMKGAPDVVLEHCSAIAEEERTAELSSDEKKAILKTNTEMAQKALRVLAVAYRPIDEDEVDLDDEDTIEKDFIFAGLVGMIDPARPEAAEAVETAKKAGIRTVMVTGDYKETAAAIASKIGILREGGKVLSGSEIDEISDDDFEKTVEEVDAFARVSPQHKVRILQALRKLGHVAAMTGDGVNDAPALKRADIGIAMGITGTDVAKQTAEMVLTDDNFASIVSAVEEGRTIYSNIRKFVYYLISCNIGEILIIFLAMVFGWMVPLTPIMILWLNLVTDGAPALALGVEKGDPDIMKRPPRPPKEPVINKEMLGGLIVQAVVMTAAVLGSYLLALQRYPGDIQTARTIAFATLVCSELWRAFTARSERYSVFKTGLFSNRWMLAAVASSLFFLLLIIYLPFLQNVFNIRSLLIGDWLRLLPFTFAAALAAEITKFFLRRKKRS